MTVSFNRPAEQELIFAAQQFETKARLGAAFLDEYEEWEQKARRFPKSCPEIAPGIRAGFLPRFKYHVTYQVRGDIIRILYVRHARQAPLTAWPRR